ncbi:tRNA pseudouridine(31) synthase [[Candida] jaroonii]|uniref:tRNA pseudouridine(31) synthase n=1 Tax=[Candida] jaroonii TaxID=467808 RepID=A0ACA9Y804_9ASCO|nr:tRNA pseudouridine(31) synthase [[Candida] jaroonii]
MTYVIENSIRRVVPYYKLYQTHIKTRWEGRTLTDVFTKEFGQSESQVNKEIEENKLYVISRCGFKDQSEYKGSDVYTRLIAKNDVICNLKHIHEPEVSDNGIEIVHESDDLLVVNKPPGIPTHPTSSYRYNSVLEILKNDLGIDLWTTHRLDKVTTGILIFGKNKASAVDIMDKISRKDITTKEYFARVKGEFPEGKIRYTCPVFLVNANGGYLMPSTVPLNTTTKFERIKYNSDLDESIVKCFPISGKMHQIRIHLRNLGHPISDDFFYHDSLKNTIEMEIYKHVFLKYPSLDKYSKDDSNDDDTQIGDEEMISFSPLISESIKQDLENLKKQSSERIESYKKGKMCEDCGKELMEPDPKKSSIYLHAFHYKFPEFEFQTSSPSWCDI